MSLSSLRLVDCRQTVDLVIPNTLIRATLAALTGEPETILELDLALTRYVTFPDSRVIKHLRRLGLESCPGNERLILDLAARTVVCKNNLQVGPEGDVYLHNGATATDVKLPYLISNEWLFISSVSNYESVREHRLREFEGGKLIDYRVVLQNRLVTCCWENETS